MTDDSFSEGENDFSPESDPLEGGFGSQDPDDFASAFAPEESSGQGMDASFALMLAQTWIEEHQTKAMLGAFAAGVLVGSLLRD